jgi:nitrite reductase/ring-hydroxylating ferredoxin subunit
MDPRWTPAFPLASLAPGSARVYKHPDAQVAVFHLADGALHAVDNRCPHEGYPLAAGTVRGCILTCQWHNFKFDLRDGSPVMGEEGVRTYPVRVQDGVVEVDLAPPPGLVDGIWADLEAAMVVQETGRIARGVVRLLALGVPPARIAAQAAIFDAQRAEYGTTHALPFAAAALDPTPGVEPALPLVQALDLAARSHVRLPRRSAPAAIDPGEDPIEAGLRVRAAVEAEDPAAEALVRGAVEKGWLRAELEPWFFGLCADHFLDF